MYTENLDDEGFYLLKLVAIIESWPSRPYYFDEFNVWIQVIPIGGKPKYNILDPWEVPSDDTEEPTTDTTEEDEPEVPAVVASFFKLTEDEKTNVERIKRENPELFNAESLQKLYGYLIQSG